MSLRVRERPPLRVTHSIETPSGRMARWAEDEPRAENIPSDLRFSDTMPGGFERCEASLPRQPARDFPDLERLSTWRVHDAAGEIVSETRLERAPRVSGDRMAISPAAVGLQAHLEDTKGQGVYVDRDFSHWIGASAQRRINALGFGTPEDAEEHQVQTDTGEPALSTGLTGTWAQRRQCEANYSSPVDLGALKARWKRSSVIDSANADWEWQTFLAENDVFSGALSSSGNLRAAGPGIAEIVNTAAGQRHAMVRLRHLTSTGTAGVAGTRYEIWFTVLAVYDRHGLPLYGGLTATTAPGVLASDVIAHFLAQFCPLLKFTTGPQGTIQPSAFVIPHLEFRDRTTPAEMLRQANRFELRDWAVWDNKTFHYHRRGARGKNWRARVGPSGLHETGQSVERLPNVAYVSYRDVAGSTHTVGPPGSGAHTEDDRLKDSDTENPFNKLGIEKPVEAQIDVSVGPAAVEIGAKLLEELKALDSSGQADLIGHVEDDRGIWHPVTHVRSGDTVTFVDAADPSPRRIVKKAYSHRSVPTAQIDLDAPPEGLEALKERLDISVLNFT